jgi:hypothetical protein
MTDNSKKNYTKKVYKSKNLKHEQMITNGKRMTIKIAPKEVNGINMREGTARIDEVLSPKETKMMIDLSIGAAPTYEEYLDRLKTKGGKRKISMSTWRKTKKRESRKKKNSMSTWRRSKKRRLFAGKKRNNSLLIPGKIPE